MPGPGINSYSTTPANNVQAVTSIVWDEGMSPGLVNNSARQNMADTRAAVNDLVWFLYGTGDEYYAPVYASGTSFTVAGIDVRTPYHTGRRVRAVGSSTGTIYGAISSSTFSTDTTVNVTWDSGSLSNEALIISISQVPVTGSPVPWKTITNTLSGDVSLNNTSNYFDGPSVAQGTAGTWFASGTVTLWDTGAAASFSVKLWDGTTVIASSYVYSATSSAAVSVALSGVLTAPAANIKISVRDVTNTTGKILYNQSSNGADSTLTVIQLG